MEKIYTTKLVLNGTNLSFTVPLPLVKQVKTWRGTPWKWSDTITPGALLLVPYHGTTKKARERAKTYGDVVFLQQMNRKNGSSQYKINLPRWIYDDKKLADVHVVEMVWSKTAEGEINGKIVLPAESENSESEKEQEGDAE